MADASGGYVLIYRRLLDHPAFRNPAEAMAFAYLVVNASWRPARVRYKERTITLQRGQLAMSVRDFAAAMVRSKSWADRFLKRLANRDMIETADGTGVNVITICNYSEYQAETYDGGTVVELKPGQDRDTEQRRERKKEEYTLPLERENKVSGFSRAREDFSMPDWMPLDAWSDWLDMRRRIRKPATAAAQRLAVNRLTQFMAKGHDPRKILERAILHSWQGLFADDKDGTTYSQQKQSAWDGRL